MKLSEKTTKALCATPRKLVMFRWPEDSRHVPKEEGVYTLEGRRDARFKVITVVCNDGVYDVAALMHDDPPRLMTKSGHGYERDPGMLATSMDDLGIIQRNPRIMRSEDEPEAVDAETQERFSAEAREKEASKMALVDALYAGAERLRREAPEVGREAWQMQARADAARMKLNHKRGSLDIR